MELIYFSRNKLFLSLRSSTPIAITQIIGTVSPARLNEISRSKPIRKIAELKRILLDYCLKSTGFCGGLLMY